MRWISSFFVIFAATWWLLVPVLSELHFVLVQHSICDEHGELVEGELSTEDHAGHTHDGADYALTEGSVPSDHHDHGCSFSASQLSLAQPDAIEPHVVATLDRELGQYLESQGARSPPLDFAPKTSPPKA